MSGCHSFFDRDQLGRGGVGDDRAALLGACLKLAARLKQDGRQEEEPADLWRVGDGAGCGRLRPRKPLAPCNRGKTPGMGWD